MNVLENETAATLTGRDFLTIAEFTEDELMTFLNTAVALKTMQKQGVPHHFLNGQTLAMIFEKASTRTRVAFEVGMYHLGGSALYLSSKDIQIGRGETIADTAKVLSRFVDGIMIRTFGHDVVEELAANADVPVINGLTDTHHPTQIIADLLTIYEHKGKIGGLKACFIGDGFNNMAHSLMEGAAAFGMDMTVASPKGYEPDAAIFEAAKARGAKNGCAISVTDSPQEAAKDCDVVITDTWLSMGDEAEKDKRLHDFQGFQVDDALVSLAKPDHIFMHCLPAHRGEEVTESVIDGDHSVVFDEAENRLHAHKAILKCLMEKDA
ncbi:ornithine carbamoyltransferase [Sporolactobacillus terrae]|uniref:Ornithine carbamoyltransferase n=1 Tax=Sporolactobacillus terrae TaxID=269673 RepID=A0ABX5QAC7_9BACL|nr:ornithine carbamoyltransferase [Sporolactobacillus terrae]QAA26565.1 ornithine carbamoyltransferase [Sporolactobacillus terrae]UAK15636.1 ornithine carbamoyltransferase [Sporolactobacillus terrae]